MKKPKTKLTIRRIILLMFIIAITLSGICYSLLIFSGWITSVKESTEQVAASINVNIFNQINRLIQVPYHMNEVNHKIITNDMLDLSNDEQRDRFFVGVIQSHSSEIYSFSYGTSTGEYYGARRNDNGVVEIMINNEKTGGNSWYYALSEHLSAGELVLKAGSFDPRTRAWYQAAVDSGEPIFSPVYKHFVKDDLTVSAAWPVYDASGTLEGVLGSHMLLSDIGEYLIQSVNGYNGIALIIEKETNRLIANSLNIDNFTALEDGTINRLGIEDINHKDIQKAFEKLTESNVKQQYYQGATDNYYVNAREIQMTGIDWIVISAIPESYLMVDVRNSMLEVTLVATLFILLSIALYNMVIRKYLKPMKELLQVSEDLSAGDLSKRVEIIRNDEIGLISQSFNSVADTMQTLINNLEVLVENRTKALKLANQTLEEYKDELQLILDSAAEAIYGIDMDGNCTFCNVSCLRILGYNRQDDLLGKNMHQQIHQYHRDGSLFPIHECKILRSIKEGRGFTSENEVFWRSDGTAIEVEYFAYPQIKNGEVVGAVITFMDITERTKRDNEILYLTYHDVLTGLHNRRYFEEHRDEIDNPANLPLSIIFADINGLKMTNDIFGHSAGDELIKKSSEILKGVCRQNDLIARIGGDEFIIILPNTNEHNVKSIIERIRDGFADAQVSAIKCSVSLGYDIKTTGDQLLDQIIATAENQMYKDKVLNRNKNNKTMIDTLIMTLHSKSKGEKQHSDVVSQLSHAMGLALKLSEIDLNKLVKAAYLHDIGKIILEDDILYKYPLSDEEFEEMKQHAIAGYRILNLFDDTLDIAEYVYCHHERWDGKGYPRGLKGNQIPLLSRIISVAETYDRILQKTDIPLDERKQAAIERIQKGNGAQFDPEVVALFIQIIGAQ